MASFTVFGSTTPNSSTSRYVTSNPCFSSDLALFKTGKSSILDTIMCLPFLFTNAIATPLIAVLLDSELPDVKINSFSLAPITLAIVFLLFSSASRASIPIEYPVSEVGIA